MGDVMIEEIIMTVVILSRNVIIDERGTGAGHLITDCEINTASIKN